MPQTLPQALLLQAHTRGSAIALRYKHLGIWHTRSWSELAHEVNRLAAALQARNFRQHDDLLIISQARPEALLLALAAQWLGGSVTLLDPDRDNRALLAGLRPRFVLAQDLQALQHLREDAVVMYLDGRGLSQQQSAELIAYTDLSAETPAPRLRHATRRYCVRLSCRHPAALDSHAVAGGRSHAGPAGTTERRRGGIGRTGIRRQRASALPARSLAAHRVLPQLSRGSGHA